MFLAGILSWWYKDGLMGKIDRTAKMLKYTADYFSFKILLSTLFAPYKQISSDIPDGQLSYKIRAFFDRLLSRFIGLFVRTFVLLVGTVFLLLQLVYGVLMVVIWLVNPFIIVVALILMTVGWTP